VLDASVPAKWFLLPPLETLTAEAIGFLRAFEKGHIRLLVPDLFWPEIGSVFWKAVRHGRMSLAAAQNAIRSVRDLNIPTWPNMVLVEDAFANATRSNQTV
jgi:predicted nucleic acid-binding protein